MDCAHCGESIPAAHCRPIIGDKQFHAACYSRSFARFVAEQERNPEFKRLLDEAREHFRSEQ